jgi:hypothetical protein
MTAHVTMTYKEYGAWLLNNWNGAKNLAYFQTLYPLQSILPPIYIHMHTTFPLLKAVFQVFS